MSKLKYFTVANSLFFLTFNLINSFGIAILFQKFQQSFLYSIGALVVIRIIYVLLLPLLTNFIGKIGTRSAVIIGMLFLFFSTVSLFFLESNSYVIYLWIVLMAIAFCFYFLPVTFFTSRYTNSGTRGIEVSFIYSGIIFASALTPLISASLVNRYSIQGFALFLAVLILFGIVPFSKLDNFHFEFKSKFRPFLKFNRSLLKASWIETCHFSTRYLNVFWILYIFIFFDQNYQRFGLILTAITLFSGIINLFAGRFLNQHNRKNILKTQVIFSPFSWIFRILATSTAGIFFADAFHNFNGYLRESAVETTAFDLLNRDNHHEALDEKIVVREIIINLGVIVTLVVAILLASYFGIRSSFVLGILISLGYLLI